MSSKFSVKLVNSQGNSVLNICDMELLGRDVKDNGHTISIDKKYYGEKVVGSTEARDLLAKSSIISMVGKDTVSAAIDLGIGTERGVKTIDGVPFLVAYRL